MNKKQCLECLSIMLKIRLFEERVIKLYSGGEIPGWIHTYIGEEAVAAGVCLNLTEGDYITSTHRGHGHCIAMGINMKNMMAELYGKIDGCCKGRGGSMHIADVSKGVLGANGIVGGGIPMATGAAFGQKYLKNSHIVVSFFGDGAADQGGFHESLNIASIWKLPIIYVCENNLYAETNPFKNHCNIKNISDRSKAYNIPGVIVNGMDVIDVYESFNNIVNDVRDGKGPILAEVKTYRYRGHWEGDPQIYRTQQEINEWMEKDPIVKLENKLLNEKLLTQSNIEDIKKQINKEIDEAIDFARKSPKPKIENAYDYIFS